MESRAIPAAGKFGHGYTCSQAVLCTYCDLLGLTEEEARVIAAPYSAGRKIKCGAVCAAALILKDEKKIAELEKRFTAANSSIICAELRGVNGVKLRSCSGCVEDAARIMEDLLQSNDK